MLQGMEGSALGVWIACGEGRANFPDPAVMDRVIAEGLAPIRFAVRERACFTYRASPTVLHLPCPPVRRGGSTRHGISHAACCGVRVSGAGRHGCPHRDLPAQPDRRPTGQCRTHRALTDPVPTTPPAALLPGPASPCRSMMRARRCARGVDLPARLSLPCRCTVVSDAAAPRPTSSIGHRLAVLGRRTAPRDDATPGAIDAALAVALHARGVEKPAQDLSLAAHVPERTRVVRRRLRWRCRRRTAATYLAASCHDPITPPTTAACVPPAPRAKPPPFSPCPPGSHSHLPMCLRVLAYAATTSSE
jgi:hypothetical protein